MSADPARTPTPAKPGSRASASAGGSEWVAVLLFINFYGRIARDEESARARPRAVQPVLPRSRCSAGHVAARSPRRGRPYRHIRRLRRVTRAPKKTKLFQTEIPDVRKHGLALVAAPEEERRRSTPKPLDTGSPWWESLLAQVRADALHRASSTSRFRRAGSMQNALLAQFGRSSARKYEPGGDMGTFKDVAGIEEGKQELLEVVDFLRDRRNTKLGARIPHGVLLSRPPGASKTLLARADAGEANVPFFSMAASEFVEAIVGIGLLSRTRPLHEGERSGAVDHLHRRARRHRPLRVRHRGIQRRQRRATSRRSTRSSPRWTASTRPPV